MAENHMLRANFAALSSIEVELMPIEVLHCGIGIFAFFCSCNLDLDPTTFVYELDPYPLKMCPQTENKLATSGLSNSKVIVLLQADT